MGEIVKANFDPSATLSVLSKTDEYLQHYGINGMKWGARNGPPYPLNNSQRTAKERKLNPVSEAIENYRKKAKEKAVIVAEKAKQKAIEKKEKLAAEHARMEEEKKKYNYKALSNSELQEYITRARLEQQYRETVLPKKKDSFLLSLAKEAGTNFSRKVLNEVLIPKAIESMKGKKPEKNSLKELEKVKGDLSKLSDEKVAALSKRAANSSVYEKWDTEKKKKADEEAKKTLWTTKFESTIEDDITGRGPTTKVKSKDETPWYSSPKSSSSEGIIDGGKSTVERALESMKKNSSKIEITDKEKTKDEIPWYS